MNRTAALIALVCAAPALADEPTPMRGSATFADGRGHITFNAGWVEMDLAPVSAGGAIIIDGVALEAGDVDSLDGSVFGGAMTLDLPGAAQPTWLGRNLRLKAGFERQRGRLYEAALGNSTITSSIEVRSVSTDGRAFAYSNSNITGTTASTVFYGPGTDDVVESCSGTSGATNSDALLVGSAGDASCSIGTSVSNSSVTVDLPGTFVLAQASAEILASSIDVLYLIESVRRIETRRASLALEGDYDAGPGLTLSPSLGLIFGETKYTFYEGQALGDNATLLLFKALRARAVSHDAGINLGARVTYDAGPSLDLFVSGAAALLRRKVDLESAASTQGILNGEYTVAVSGASEDDLSPRLTDTTLAFQGQLEAGAGYTFDPHLGVGPLRFAVTGGMMYDSDVASYGNVATPDVIPDAPIAPAHVAFEAETTLFLKAEITIELP